jgi:glycosyltransferase involved in cell wall biosynthesis
MKLLIISHMPHHLRSDGRVVGWGPTVQELDQLATRFEEVRHIACLHDGAPPASSLPYEDDRVRLIPVRPTGGDRLRDKPGVLRAAPGYVRTMLRELPHADMVHIRCPANVPMIATILLPFLSSPGARWIKYAGNWRPTRHDSVAWAFQRWWLARPWHRGTVTINGTWPGQPAHVRSFYNPSLSEAELVAARASTEAKRLELPIRLLFVGRLEAAKGIDQAIAAFAQVVGRGIDATFDIVGDGAGRPEYEALARDLGVRQRVTFHGWLPRPALPEHYARAHLMLFPTTSEGWPKVLSEGMAYGVVPVTFAVGAIPQYLAEFATGVALETASADAFAGAVADYAADPGRWLEESRRARAAATNFSYATYLAAVDGLLEELR